MLSENVFKNCLVGLCKMNGVSIEQDTLKMYYAKICNDFTDDEFQSIANQILEEENLYGKFPAPVLFYKRKNAKKEAVEQNSLQKSKQAFIEKVMDIVNTDYVPLDWKEDFRKSLTPTEAATMATLGDISLLWGSVRVNGNFDDVKAEYLVRRLGGEFEKNFRPERDSRLMIGVVPDEEMKKNIDLLIKGVFS